jgi:sugar (pentulose or hexulose) kinase
VEAGAAPGSGTVADVERIVRRQTFALPSFTRSGGPMPGTGGRGRIEGPQPRSDGERAALASLYCALMTDLSLDAVGSTATIIVDGPFGRNPVFTGVLAQLRREQKVTVSDLRDGTTAGAALLGAMTKTGDLPHRPITLEPVKSLAIDGLDAYRAEWLSLARANAV